MGSSASAADNINVVAVRNILGGDSSAVGAGAGTDIDVVAANTMNTATAAAVAVAKQPRGRKPKGTPMSKLSDAESSTTTEGKNGDKNALFSATESIESILASIVADSSDSAGGM